jgi:hypothetical protein
VPYRSLKEVSSVNILSSSLAIMPLCSKRHEEQDFDCADAAKSENGMSTLGYGG